LNPDVITLSLRYGQFDPIFLLVQFYHASLAEAQETAMFAIIFLSLLSFKMKKNQA